MKNHEKAFSDIKNYYNDITLNNLALINSLKVITFSLISCIVHCFLRKLQIQFGTILLISALSYYRHHPLLKRCFCKQCPLYAPLALPINQGYPTFVYYSTFTVDVSCSWGMYLPLSSYALGC